MKKSIIGFIFLTLFGLSFCGEHKKIPCYSSTHNHNQTIHKDQLRLYMWILQSKTNDQKKTDDHMSFKGRRFDNSCVEILEEYYELGYFLITIDDKKNFILSVFDFCPFSSIKTCLTPPSLCEDFLASSSLSIIQQLENKLFGRKLHEGNLGNCKSLSKPTILDNFILTTLQAEDGI